MTGPRVRRRRRRPLALVYHPDGSEAYARLITVPRGADVTIQVCATEEEAAAHIGDAEILYCCFRRRSTARPAACAGCRPWAPAWSGRWCPTCAVVSS